MKSLIGLSFKNAAVLASSFFIAGAAVSGCAPNDEKIRAGGFSGSNGGGDVDARFSDHSKEYTRSMLIELADVARQTESVLQVVTPVVGDPVVAMPLRISSCKVVQTVPSPAGTVKFQTDIKSCKEKGPTFEGVQYGRETAFASVVKNQGEADLATVIRVEGKGLETTLNPVKNLKDALRVKTSRFLEAEFVSQAQSVRTYRFSFESHSSYNLDLKASVDNGQIISKVQGVFEFDLVTRKIVMFRSLAADDRSELKVISGRQSKNGGRVARQEFFGSGTSQELAIDLGACALPVGQMKSRFTVGPLGGGGAGKKYDIDSTVEILSSEDSIVDKAKLGLPKSTLSAKLCSADEQITMTEFFAGLLY